MSNCRVLGLLCGIAMFLFCGVSALLADSPFEITPDVVYGHKAGLALTYDVIRHKGHRNGAAVVFIMSRNWVSPWAPPSAFVGDSGPDGFKDFPEIAPQQHFRQLVEKGYVLYIVRHGSAPYFKIPEHVADVRRAVRHIRLHAERFEIDIRRIGVCGGSAGGHLALILGTASDPGQSDAPDEVERTSNRVATVVAFFPVVDFDPQDVDFEPELVAKISPILHVTSDDSPTLLICGNQDGLLNHSQRMYEALQRSTVPSRLIVIEGAGHGFRGPNMDRASAALVEWMDQHLMQPVRPTVEPTSPK